MWNHEVQSTWRTLLPLSFVVLRGKTFNTSEAKAFSVSPFIPKAQRRARACKFRPIISVFPRLNASFFAPCRWKMIMCLTSEKEMSSQAELSFEVKKKRGQAVKPVITRKRLSGYESNPAWETIVVINHIAAVSTIRPRLSLCPTNQCWGCTTAETLFQAQLACTTKPTGAGNRSKAVPHGWCIQNTDLCYGNLPWLWHLTPKHASSRSERGLIERGGGGGGGRGRSGGESAKWTASTLFQLAQDAGLKKWPRNSLFNFKSQLVSFQVVFVEHRHHTGSIHGSLRITL